jgi:pentatricopeptide repeat protein
MIKLYSKYVANDVSMFKQAETLFNDLKKSGIQLNVVLYGVMIKCYVNRATVDTGMVQQAEKLFEEMKQAGIQPDVVILSIF